MKTITITPKTYTNDETWLQAMAEYILRTEVESVKVVDGKIEIETTDTEFGSRLTLEKESFLFCQFDTAGQCFLPKTVNVFPLKNYKAHILYCVENFSRWSYSLSVRDTAANVKEYLVANTEVSYDPHKIVMFSDLTTIITAQYYDGFIEVEYIYDNFKTRTKHHSVTIYI